MTSTQASNPRASLLAGLRTGGVRSSSATMPAPHTAAASANFSIPRYPSQQYYYEDEEEDQFYDLPNTAAFNNYAGARAHPVTAAVDGPDNRFHQQQRGLNPHSAPFNPSFNSRNAQVQQQQSDHQAQQAFQMQMMQLELLKMQQAQQYQAELLAQAQHQAKVERRASLGYGLPATAGPTTNTFDFRSAAASAQMRRGSQQFPESAPMTAAVGGRFSNRSVSAADYGANDHYNGSVPPTPASTTVISGGTSLGNMASNNVISNVPSKSDTASSWRRGGPSNSVLSNRSVTSPVKSNNPALPSKTRPQPLQFNAAVSRPLRGVALADGNDADDGFSSDSSNSPGYNTGSSPTTPRSSSSNESPLSPREEATKKLYEGLGIGRPKSNVSSTGLIIPSVTINDHVDPLPVSYRMVSQPLRQPRGPPSGADELGPQNFATRIRRQAIGGLGALMGARERRESFVEAY